MKGKDSFKGMPAWKGKGKGDGKNKGGKPLQCQQLPQADVAQQASSSASQAPEKTFIAQAEESWSYDYDTCWTDDWSTYESYFGYDGDYSQGSVKELTVAEDKHSEDFGITPEDGQTDQNNRFVFFDHLFVPISRTRTYVNHYVHVFVRVSAVPGLSGLNRNSVQSIRFAEESIATDSGDPGRVCIPELRSWCPTSSTPLRVRGSWFSSDLCDS